MVIARIALATFCCLLALATSVSAESAWAEDEVSRSDRPSTPSTSSATCSLAGLYYVVEHIAPGTPRTVVHDYNAIAEWIPG